MARKSTKSKRVTSHGSRATKPPRKAALSESAVRDAAYESADLAAAAERLAVPDLADRLKRSKRLAAAWERGRLLRRIRDVAAGPLVPEAADKDLGLPKGALVKLLKTDMIVRDLWNDTRHEAIQRVRRSIMDLAGQGNTTALTAFERIIEPKGSAGEVDYGRMTPAELGRATGILAQQWARWVRESNCPQNIDGTYSLSRVLDWLRRWERDKATGGREAAGLNPLQAEKARRERRENEEAEGRLLPIDKHWEAMFAHMHCLQRLVSGARARDIVALLVGRSVEEQERVLDEEFRQIVAAFEKLSPDVPVPDEARAKMTEALGLLTVKKGTADER